MTPFIHKYVKYNIFFKKKSILKDIRKVITNGRLKFTFHYGFDFMEVALTFKLGDINNVDVCVKRK